ncbi:MAG: phosphoserine phosphatase RsbU/P [Solirubrobacteraceae bacterium]|nr:phosphoserine phosphatase RsbU/P [Solirubrobacteraceae bacterium]
MTSDGEPFEDTAEDLFEDAPCGYLSTLPDGTIVRVNRTFETWTGLRREELVGTRRFQDLLSPGGRIYHETHYAPLLRMQGSVREIAVEIVRADGTRLSALINSVLHNDPQGHPQCVRTIVFDATDRRRYEDELLRARRQEQETAQQLSRSLLSGSLPTAPGLEVEVVYRPAVSGLEVGGDWYDAFWLDDGDTIGLVVGDVVGRGIAAAATMGQLRSAVRALASTGLGPGHLLDALDAYAARHGVGTMTTLICAELALGSRRLRYACAGHPPPLVLSPGEDPFFAWDGRSTPLDVGPASPGARSEAALALAPGCTVLFYTDGLIERRSESLTEGMDRLLQAAATHRDETAARLAATLVRSLHDPAHVDDVCVLAARVR